MNVRVLPAGENLIREVLSYIEGSDSDYSSSLVVFPGKRPSHFLRKALAAKHGTSFIPPHVLSMDEFVDCICEQFSRSGKIEAIDAVALLYDIHKKSRKPLGGKGFMTPDSFFSLGLKLYSDLEELFIEETALQRLKEVETLTANGLPEQTGIRLQSLSYFYEQFFEKVGALGFATRSMQYRTAAGRIVEYGLSRYRKVIFAGFFALTRSEKTLFQTLLPLDNTVFLFQDGPGLKEELGHLGISCECVGEKSSGPDIQFYESPDTHGQVMALGNMLATRTEAGVFPDEKTVIVLPSSDTLFPLLHQGLSTIPENTYNVSLGYPLRRTPLFGFLNTLMELVNSMEDDRVYIPDYLKFVLHPYTKNIYFRGKSETTRILFHSIEEELLTHKTRTFIPLGEIEENRSLFRAILKKLPAHEEDVTEDDLKAHLKSIHTHTIEKFYSLKDISDFASKCAETIIYIFNESTAKRHPLFHPFAESFITSLDVLAKSLMKNITFTDRSSYFIFFRKYLLTCRTPFTGTPLKGLQVLGFLETRNLQFNTVYVLDTNEDILPDTAKEETLLPFKVRELLGLPTYKDRDRLTAYYFDSLLNGAAKVHLFFIKNDRKEPSRFVEKLLWERQKIDRETSSIPYIRPIQYQVNLINRAPAPVSKTGEMVAYLRGYHYNATALNQYLKCPLQFYYARVLGLGPRDEITGDIERDDLGTFVHNVLSRYFSDKRGRPLKESDLSVKEMASLAEALFEKEYSKEPSGALYLLKRQVTRRMADLLAYYYIPLSVKNELTILEIEKSLKIYLNGFHLKGRLDSVEQRGGTTVIVDFKTGAVEYPLKIRIEKLDIARRETWGRAIGSLQLPFYLLLYTEKENRPIDEFNALFLMMGSSVISDDIELRLFHDSSPVETFGQLRALIFRLLDEIIDPGIPFSAADQLKTACPACDFKYICGTAWTIK